MIDGGRCLDKPDKNNWYPRAVKETKAAPESHAKRRRSGSCVRNQWSIPCCCRCKTRPGCWTAGASILPSSTSIVMSGLTRDVSQCTYLNVSSKFLLRVEYHNVERTSWDMLPRPAHLNAIIARLGRVVLAGNRPVFLILTLHLNSEGP